MIMQESKDIVKEEAGRAGRWFGEIWEVAKVIIISLAIVLPIRYFVAQPFIVRGASMVPTFQDREYLVIDEFSYYLREPQRGEAIVFRYPRDPGQFFIKRIIGLPGEKIEIMNGRIKIFNQKFPEGFTLEEPYLDPPGLLTRPDVHASLGSNEFFVLGDNRGSSSDSRVWGSLPENLIVGRALFRAWPIGRSGLVPDFSMSY